MEMSAAGGLLVVTADEVLLDHALAACAAAGVEPEVMSDPGAARSLWTRAELVVVGSDQAERVVHLGLPRRSQVLLLDVDGGRDLTGPSARLGAPVALLPSGASDLVTAMAASGGRAAPGGRVVAVLGGSGGVGASTLAAALAFVAARLGRTAMVIDLDPLGGGIDLLVGGERVPGWRWPRLSAARGQLGVLSGQVPQVDGVDLVAMGRGAGDAEVPAAEAVSAVLGSAVRSHDLIVLDLGRGVGARSAALPATSIGLLLVAGDVRGVAAGRETFSRLARGVDDWHLVVRRPRSGGLSPSDAADGFEPPLVAVVDDDPAVAQVADRGEPPARPARSPLARACRQVLEAVVWPGEVTG